MQQAGNYAKLLSAFFLQLPFPDFLRARRARAMQNLRSSSVELIWPLTTTLCSIITIFKINYYLQDKFE
jgi:hypothetical protein